MQADRQTPALVKLVGLDFGTTTSSAVVAAARLVRNSVTGRKELGEIAEQFRSATIFTPFCDDRIDIDAIARHLDQWLAQSDTRPGDIFGGGAIITGLAARQSNAAVLADLVRQRIGETLIATADDRGLESWLAFMGNCRGLSRAEPDCAFLNLDIGGGTTNLAWGQNGVVSRVGCYFIGARHVRVALGTYQIAGLSEFAERLLADLKIAKRVGDALNPAEVEAIVAFYVSTLEALVRGADGVLSTEFVRFHEQMPFRPVEGITPIVTLSGGVGELVYRLAQGQPLPGTTAFGDLGIDLARAIWRSAILSRDLAARVPPGLGHATVYGLAVHSTEISGSTLFLPRPELLPVRDVPIVGRLTGQSGVEQVRALVRLARSSGRAACLDVECAADDAQAVRQLGRQLADAVSETLPADAVADNRVLVLLVRENVGKTLGQYASRWGRLPVNLIVIDEVSSRAAQFVSIGRVCDNVVPVSFYGLGP